MAGDINSFSRSARNDELLQTIACPNSYYDYPLLIEIAAIPHSLRQTLDYLWKRSVHRGRDINVYKFSDVFIVKEGLIFDRAGTFIDCTRTYHDDESIIDARNQIEIFKTEKKYKNFERGVVAKSRGAENYGHFIVEMLPRAWIARQKLGLSGWPAVIYDKPASVCEKAIEALSFIGYGQDQVIVTSPEPTYFNELIFVDGLSYHTQYLSPFIMQCLDAVGENIAARSAERIYVPRRPAVTRDFAAETAVASRLCDRGFVEAQTATMSFADQIATFKGAEVVVGVMGAALTNIVFCRPGTKVVMFMPCNAAEVFFWMLAAARKLHYHEIRCPEIGPQIGPLPWDRLIDVSPDKVIELVNAAS